MGYESFVSGDARGQDLLAQLLAQGFTLDNIDNEIVTPDGEYTGVFANGQSAVDAGDDWRPCYGFRGLIQALHKVNGLEEVRLERQGEDPDDKEAFRFHEGEWYTLVSIEQYVLEDKKALAIQAAEMALAPFSESEADVECPVFYPYPNPEFGVEILQSVGRLRLAREALGNKGPCFGVHVISWDRPRDAAPDPERPGYQVALPNEELPVRVISLRVTKRTPRQRRHTAVLASILESSAFTGYLTPEAAAWLLAGLGFDPAPLWAEVEAAGWTR